jgi:hypothetical protein
VARALLDLRVPAGAARADVLAAAGDILLTAGRDAEAYHLFQRAVEENPGHVGARRRLRLRGMRDGTKGRDKDGLPGAGLLGGLFKKRTGSGDRGPGSG